MINILRPWLGRVLAAMIAGLSAWLSANVGPWAELTPEEQANLAETIVPVMLTVGLTVYGAAHKLINSKINPADAASQPLAEQGKAEQSAAKAEGG